MECLFILSEYTTLPLKPYKKHRNLLFSYKKTEEGFVLRHANSVDTISLYACFTSLEMLLNHH